MVHFVNELEVEKVVNKVVVIINMRTYIRKVNANLFKEQTASQAINEVVVHSKPEF